MAQVKVVELQIKTSIDGATSGINKLTTGLKEAKTESKALNETMQGSKESEFINKLGDNVGKLNPAFGTAVKGANGLILKMWELVANPVGAILAAIVVTVKFLYEAFQSSVAGGKELKTIFAGISAVGTQVKDAIFGLGRALIDATTAAYKFITLDFKGAAAAMKAANKEATESYNQLSNAVDGTTFTIIRNLEKQQQANDKARKISAVEEAKTNLLLVKSRDILMDETASINEKKKALALVTKVETESSKERERIAAKDLDIAKQRAKAIGGEEEKKAKQEIRTLEIAYYQAQTETAQNGIKLSKQRKQLLRQETADSREAVDAQKTHLKELADARKEYLDKNKALSDESNLYVTDIDKLRRDKEKADMIADLQSKVANGQNWVEERKRLAAQEISEEEKVAEAKKEIQDATFNNVFNGIGLLKVLFEKNKGLQKALLIAESAAGIAKIVINTKASNAAFALKYALLPGGELLAKAAQTQNNISAGIGIAANIAATAKGLSALGGGGANGGASIGSDGGGSSAPQFNVVGASSTNQLAQSIGQKQGQPIKAYVVGSEVTTQQSLDRNIVSTATL